MGSRNKVRWSTRQARDVFRCMRLYQGTLGVWLASAKHSLFALRRGITRGPYWRLTWTNIFAALNNLTSPESPVRLVCSTEDSRNLPFTEELAGFMQPRRIQTCLITAEAECLSRGQLAAGWEVAGLNRDGSSSRVLPAQHFERQHQPGLLVPWLLTPRLHCRTPAGSASKQSDTMPNWSSDLRRSMKRQEPATSRYYDGRREGSSWKCFCLAGRTREDATQLPGGAFPTTNYRREELACSGGRGGSAVGQMKHSWPRGQGDASWNWTPLRVVPPK